MCEKLDGLSMDLENTNMEKLKSVFPECFSEGKLDIDKLLSLYRKLRFLKKYDIIENKSKKA